MIELIMERERERAADMVTGLISSQERENKREL